MRRALLLLAFLALSLFYAGAYCRQANLKYTYTPQPLARDFKTFYERNRNFSLRAGVPGHATERLVVNNPENSGIAILYIHGFGASRAEGEYTVDALAEAVGANVYYLRLPGHGTTAEAHAAATFEQYLATAEEALLHMPLLGKKTVVIGTSTGALVATYLASRHSDRLHALIVASPLWDFANKTTRLLNFPGGLSLGQMVMGTERDAGWKSDPENRKHADYEKHWLIKQKFAALVNLNNLRRFVVKPETFAAIKVPVLALVYYKDEKHQDEAIDVDKVREVMPQLGSAAGGKNRLVEIADGNHILLSEFVRTDKATQLREMRTWLAGL
ncbi:MAG: alpha/beta hydrolase [Spirochaetota bacterium]